MGFKGNKIQSVVLLVYGGTWALFVLSSFNYQTLPWFPWLYWTRFATVVAALITAIILLMAKRELNNCVSGFTTVTTILQASYGILEGPHRVEFYNFTALIFILTALSYSGDFRQWRRLLFPLNILIILLPAFFKGPLIVGSIGQFVDTCSGVVAGLAVAVLVSLVTTSRNKLFAEKVNLQRTLEKERDEQNEIINRQTKILAEVEIERAVARMTQMLAHDVRKPFSILRIGMGLLGRAKEPGEVKHILTRLAPEIDKAVSRVDGLIADVLEIGATSNQIIQEPMSPEALIESALGEIFRVYPQADIDISYSFEHSHLVNVHVHKVGRVFSNILSNALQAMNYKGQIWIKTREYDGVVEFCLGNSGSFIPPENLPKICEAFFTSGKKGGIGLGLAIAQKVVSAHGGRIWCESKKSVHYTDGQVEIFFTLPTSPSRSTKQVTGLPYHSSELALAREAIVTAGR